MEPKWHPVAWNSICWKVTRCRQENACTQTHTTQWREVTTRLSFYVKSGKCAKNLLKMPINSIIMTLHHFPYFENVLHNNYNDIFNKFPDMYVQHLMCYVIFYHYNKFPHLFSMFYHAYCFEICSCFL